MSTIRVATWNAEGMFVDGTNTRRANSHDALHALRDIDADIVVIPEFGDLTKLSESVITTIKSLGYQVITVPYNDPRVPGLGLSLLSRLAILKHREIPLTVTGRTMLEMYCRDEEDKSLRVIGLHLDDRNEEIRLRQVRPVVDTINEDLVTPTILMGDFNAMHASSGFARLTRTKAAAAIASHIPHEHIASVAQRVHEMAAGSTIDYLLGHTGLRNLDPSLAPTISAKQSGMEWVPSIRLAKIDWIFGSEHIAVKSHKVKKDVGSDHRQVVAEVRY